MSLKRLLIGCACLGLVAVSSAQFNAILIDTTPLTHNCDGTGGPISHGYLGYIYWDQNNNGPDDADVLPITGPGFGQCNFNQIDMGSGEDLLGIPGGFATDPAFTISTNTPQPSRYYVVVVGSTVRWTSPVFTILDGLNDYDLSQGWSCSLIVLPCESYFTIGYEDLTQDPNNRRHYTYSTCLEFCADQTSFLHGFDFPLGGGGGYATLTPGCGTNSPCNLDEGLTYAYPLWENGTNTVQLWDYSWDAWIPMVSPVDGWACLYIDIILPVAHGDFDAIAGDGQVILNWNTLAENSVERFDVLRKSASEPDFSPIAFVPATNSVSGASYSFIDQDVDNGTIYTYSLATVNQNGSTQEWGVEVNATPRFDAAVLTEYALHQNYPNPFNPTTNFVFDVVDANTVTLQIFDIQGRLTAQPIHSLYSSGRHTVSFDAANLTTGLYFYTIKIGNEFTETKKMMLIK